MNILFIRHGESQDDIEDRYGGWSDFDLTPKGKQQITNKWKDIKSLGEAFEIIITSPLKRAIQTGEILRMEFRVPMEKLEYVKERNTYGVLSGMKKEEAKKKYPDQVKKLDNGEYIDGSERYEDLTQRVKKSLVLLEKSGKKSVIVVTHGNYLKCLFKIAGKKLTKKEDGGFVLSELKKGVLTFKSSNGIEWI